MQKNETRPPSYTIHRINLKWNKDLNVRLETIKTLEENIGSKVSDIICSNTFSDISHWPREPKEKIQQMGLLQTKKVLHSKGSHQQNKKEILIGRTYLPVIHLIRVNIQTV